MSYTKPKLLEEYKNIEKRRGREYTVNLLKDNIKNRNDKRSQWRKEILEELFGESWLPVMAKMPWSENCTIPQTWDQQLADLLSPTTPIYITE
jgi:hypothetical protein